MHDRRNGPLGSLGIFRFRHQPDDLVGRSRDSRLPHHSAAVIHERLQLDVLRRIRPDPAMHFQDLADCRQSVLHAAFHIAHGGNEKVAQAVSGQGLAVMEPVLHGPFHDRFRIGQGHQTVAHISGRDDSHFFAQPS